MTTSKSTYSLGKMGFFSFGRWKVVFGRGSVKTQQSLPAWGHSQGWALPGIGFPLDRPFPGAWNILDGGTPPFPKSRISPPADPAAPSRTGARI